MRARGFSLIELVFVIVILGIIASIAIPKLSITRSSAQFAAVNADIQSIISSMQQKYLLGEVSTPVTASEIIKTANLSPLRWAVQGSNPEALVLAHDGEVDSKNNCLTIKVESETLKITVANAPSSNLCTKLKKAYPQELDYPLESAN